MAKAKTVSIEYQYYEVCCLDGEQATELAYD